jgi:hypothetical protein
VIAVPSQYAALRVRLAFATASGDRAASPRPIRGEDRQAVSHEVAVVTSGALMDGSAAVLTTDR